MWRLSLKMIYLKHMSKAWQPSIRGFKLKVFQHAVMIIPLEQEFAPLMKASDELTCPFMLLVKDISYNHHGWHIQPVHQESLRQCNTLFISLCSGKQLWLKIQTRHLREMCKQIVWSDDQQCNTYLTIMALCLHIHLWICLTGRWANKQSVMNNTQACDQASPVNTACTSSLSQTSV